jgi:hypothetical protein
MRFCRKWPMDRESFINKVWEKAKSIEDFFADVEYRVTNMKGDQKAAVLERLELARKMVDSTDALEWLVAWKTPDERYK